jgi:hypothetical protein
MKWWMLCVERRSHKQDGEMHPPSEQHSTRPPALQSPLSIFQLGIPNCHLRGSQIHIFCFSLLIPLSVFLTSVETNIFHIYWYIYIYIYMHTYKETERDVTLRFLSHRSYLQHILLHFWIFCLCLFSFMYVIRLYVLPKSFKYFIYQIQSTRIFIFLTVWVWVT